MNKKRSNHRVLVLVRLGNSSIDKNKDKNPSALFPLSQSRNLDILILMLIPVPQSKSQS